MATQRALWRWGCGLALVGALYAFQRPFRVYTSMEPYDNIPLPPDWQEKAEWVQARLMYPQHPDARFGGFGRFRRFGPLDWREGGTSWTQDYPRADRHFAQALRRLTRIHVRSDGGIERGFVVIVCRACPEPQCAKVCPSNALERREGGGVKLVSERCLGCGNCVAACPFGAAFWDDEAGKPVVCLYCGYCAGWCPHGVLELEKVQ